MATLKDVARLACVDVSTVSRALNNTSYVHPDTKARIFAAVKELSYHPNILAKGLRQGKRHTIGVVVPRLHMTVFAEVVQGIELEAREAGYAVIICTTEDDPKIEKESLARLRNGFVDGLIIAGTGHNGKLIQDIHATGLSVTQIIRQQDNRLNSVVVNYETCGYEATKYLASKGCSHIGLINGSMKIAPYRERYNGYIRALNELNLSETTAIPESVYSLNSLEYGYNCALELMSKNPYLDAILAAVDVQGIGAMRALKEKGIQVPSQIKLISLTGHIIGSMLETTMTSMEMPAKQMGRQAALMTINEIESTDSHIPRHLVFSSALVERESG